jgi:hypothetical protein
MKSERSATQDYFFKRTSFASIAFDLCWFLALVVLVLWSGCGWAQTSAPNTKDTAADPARSSVVTKVTSRNVYSVGASVRPNNGVEGDFVAAGRRVIVDQPVKGDVNVAGGSVDLRVPVGDDVRAAGGDVNIESTIGGELFAVGGTITLTKAARVASNASLFGGTVAINGDVNNDVRLRAEQIEFGQNAKISGAVNYTSPNEIRRAEGATVGGAVTRVADDIAMHGHDMSRGNHDWNMQIRRGPSWAGSAFTLLALLACACVFLLMFPVFSMRAADTVKTSPWAALGIGFAALVGVPVLAIFLFVTILGIPLGIIVLILYPLLLLMGYVVGVLFIAKRAQSAIRKDAPDSFATTIGFFALALLLVLLLGKLPVVGSLVTFIITITGIGASLIEVYSRRQTGPPSSQPREPGGAQMLPAGA